MSTRKKFLFFLFFAAIFLFLPKCVLAVTITIDNSPSSISVDPFAVDVSISGPNPGTNYLRIDLYKEETNNYFGETFNGTSWYGGTGGVQYFPVTISSEGTASATFQGRVGNPSFSEYPGPGNFKLRIRRYTSSGNPSSGDQQTPADVQITIANPTSTPTPTSTPVPEPTNTPAPTATPKPPTSTPTSKPPTVTPSLKPSPTATVSGEILGQEESSAGAFYPWEATKEAELVLGEKSSSPSRLLPAVLLGAGFVLLFSAAFWLWYTQLKK